MNVIRVKWATLFVFYPFISVSESGVKAIKAKRRVENKSTNRISQLNFYYPTVAEQKKSFFQREV
jgi:hypothetical protein